MGQSRNRRQRFVFGRTYIICQNGSILGCSHCILKRVALKSFGHGRLYNLPVCFKSIYMVYHNCIQNTFFFWMEWSVMNQTLLLDFIQENPPPPTRNLLQASDWSISTSSTNRNEMGVHTHQHTLVLQPILPPSKCPFKTILLVLPPIQSNQQFNHNIIHDKQWGWGWGNDSSTCKTTEERAPNPP